MINKKPIQHNRDLSSSKKIFWFFLLLSFLLFSIPFVLRIYYIEVPVIKNYAEPKNIGIVGEIVSFGQKNNTWSVFRLIFINNLKGCIINIIGGIMLGTSTVYNLIINGFLIADTFDIIHKNGMGVSLILKYTLPHCFELLGFWLSGAIGFSIAKLLIDFMKGKDLPNSNYFNFLAKCIVATVLIILSAAFVEAYVSIHNTK